MGTKQIKLALAAVGGGTVIAMGALGTVTADVTAAEGPAVEAGPVTTPEMTTGETTKDAPEPSKGPLTQAAPEITTTPTSAEPG